jgi:hypothetical protein
MARYGEHHDPHNGWVYNGAEIDTAKVLWARELDSAQNAKLFACFLFVHFKDRKIWLMEPDVNDTPIVPIQRFNDRVHRDMKTRSFALQQIRR